MFHSGAVERRLRVCNCYRRLLSRDKVVSALQRVSRERVVAHVQAVQVVVDRHVVPAGVRELDNQRRFVL